MGLFDFKKQDKKKESSDKKEAFEIGKTGLIFNAKIQVLTNSKEYAEELSKKYVENITQAEDEKHNRKYHIISKKIEKPKKLKTADKQKDEKGSVFKFDLDLDIGIKNRSYLFDFCFDYLPFFVEVTSPMIIDFTASDLTNYVSSIQATIHKIDEALKEANLKYQNMSKSMVRMLRNNILLSLKEKDKTLKEISKNVGIDEEQIKSFVENMVNDHEIKLKGGKYSVK